MNKDKLTQRLYELIIEKEEITESALKEKFSDEEIIFLIIERIIIEVKPEQASTQSKQYIIRKIHSFFTYGTKLLIKSGNAYSNGDSFEALRKKATKIFEICYKMCTNTPSSLIALSDKQKKAIIYQAIAEDVIANNFQAISEKIEKLRNTLPPESRNTEINIITYLLIITGSLDTSDKYYQKYSTSVFTMKPKHILLNGAYEKSEENKMRMPIFNQDFSTAFNEILNQIKQKLQKEEHSPKYLLLLELCRIATKQDKKTNDAIIELIRNQDYAGIKQMIEQLEIKRPLSRKQKSIKLLVDDILAIKNGSFTPCVPSNEQNQDIDSCIEQKSYNRALQISKSTDNPSLLGQDPLYLLLKEINRLLRQPQTIKSIKQPEDLVPEPEIPEELKDVFPLILRIYIEILNELKSEGKNFNDTLNSYKCEEQTRCLIKILAAIDCYRYREISIGDSYLNEVVNNNLKCRSTRCLLDYAYQIRTFYSKHMNRRTKISF